MHEADPDDLKYIFHNDSPFLSEFSLVPVLAHIIINIDENLYFFFSF